jgi:aspartyl-tRNA(Asn)/glutamyl-tRNA(Gln) amidotransferase subunit A
LVGLKAATGEIPTTGVFPLSASLDHVGPLAQSVRDAWAVYEVLKGTPPGPKVAMPITQVRLGRLVGYFSEKLDPQVRRRFDEALDRLKSAGATIVDVTIRHASDTPLAYARLVLTEAFAVHRDTLANSGSKYSAGVRARLEAGRDLTAEDYEWAQKDRAILRKEVDTALVKCDALVLPTLPIPAPAIGASTVRLGSSDDDIRPLMLRMTQLFNLTGNPAITLPCGLTAEGLPCGFQIVGRRDFTPELLSLSLACEPIVSRAARGRVENRDL